MSFLVAFLSCLQSICNMNTLYLYIYICIHMYIYTRICNQYGDKGAFRPSNWHAEWSSFLGCICAAWSGDLSGGVIFLRRFHLSS